MNYKIKSKWVIIMEYNLKGLSKGAFLLAVIFIFLIQIVSAQSTSPSSATYRGAATLDGKPAPTGTFITVEVENTGEVVGKSTVVDLPNMFDWSYGLSIEFEAPEIIDSENGKAHAGDNLVWKVGGIVCSDIALPGVERNDFNLVANRAPELTPIGSRSVSEGNEISITLSATKVEDFDSLMYPLNATLAVFSEDFLLWDHFFTFVPEAEDFNILTFSTNATFGELEGNVFRWTPGYTDEGVHSIEFTVSDGRGGFDSEIVEITVEDTYITPLVIESASLYPANTTPGSTIKLEVDVTGGTGVTEVSANGILLEEINGVWRGSVTASSAIGEHTILVIASDAAGNTAKTSMLYNVFSREGDVYVSVSSEENNIKPDNIASLNLKIKNNQNIDDIFKILINLYDPSESLPADFSWFEWAEKEVKLEAGEECTFLIEVEVPADTAPGCWFFKVNVDSETSEVCGFDKGHLIVS